MTDNNQSNEKAITPYAQLKQLALGNIETIQRFADAFGGNEQRARSFLSSVLTVVSMDGNLRQCDPTAILNECMRAAVLGLPINKELNLACIIAYNEKGKMTPHFQPMKQGYIELAHQTEEYLKLNTNVIYKGQKPVFDQVTGDFHIEGDENKENPVTHYFNYFLMKNGFSHVVCMSIDELEAHGKRWSKSYDYENGWWKKNPDIMYAKTVTKLNLKRYGKLIRDDNPRKKELEEALKDDDEYRLPSTMNPQQYPEDPQPEQPTGEIIEGQFTEPTPTPEPIPVQHPAPVETVAKPRKAKNDADPRIAALVEAQIAPDEADAVRVLALLKIKETVPVNEVMKIVRGFYGWKDLGASDNQAKEALNEGKYPK